MESCIIIPYLAEHGPFLNRIVSFVCPGIKPKGSNDTNYTTLTRIETRCETTTNAIIYALTGKLGEFKSLEVNKLGHIIDELNKSNMIVISIPYKGDFGGHKLLIIRDDYKYYVFQSYIFEYTLEIHSTDKYGIVLFINYYLEIFNKKEWTEKDVYLWKFITGVNIPKYTSKKPKIYILSYPETFCIYNSQHNVENLLESALIKLDNTIPEHIEDVFGDVPIDIIKDKINSFNLNQKI